MVAAIGHQQHDARAAVRPIAKPFERAQQRQADVGLGQATADRARGDRGLDHLLLVREVVYRDRQRAEDQHREAILAPLRREAREDAPRLLPLRRTIGVSAMLLRAERELIDLGVRHSRRQERLVHAAAAVEQQRDLGAAADALDRIFRAVQAG